MSQASKLALIKEMIESAESNLRSAKQVLIELTGSDTKKVYAKLAKELDPLPKNLSPDGAKIVEGVYNGETMIDPKGKVYPVPANYASKSKLIPGDVLKLTILEDGTYLYKQIGPSERKKIVGVLTYEDGQYKGIANGKAYRLLLASVTYFKGEIGDKITLIIPEFEDSDFAAIENILPRDADDLDEDE